MQSQTEQIVITMLAIVLVLFASIAAPKLPKFIAKYLENPLLRLVIFISIGYLATRNLATAIIATIAVLVSYQTLTVHNLTDNIIKKTNEVISENTSSPIVFNEPIEATNKYRQQINQNEMEYQNQIKQLINKNNNIPENYEKIKIIVKEYLMKNIKDGTYLDSHTIINDIVGQNPSFDLIVVNKAIIDILSSRDSTLEINAQIPTNLACNNKKVTFSDTVNIMEINNNNIGIKKSKKRLQGEDNVNIENNFDLVNYNLIEKTNSLLTDSCSNKHTMNFHCINLPKIDNELNGYSNDFEVNASI